jgi:hypothetical protein
MDDVVTLIADKVRSSTVLLAPFPEAVVPEAFLTVMRAAHCSEG